MRTASSFGVLITAVVVNVSCRGVLGPSCTDESGGVLRTEGVVHMGGTSSHTVVSCASAPSLVRRHGRFWCPPMRTWGQSGSHPSGDVPNPRCRRGERRSDKGSSVNLGWRHRFNEDYPRPLRA
jgi:hypothetical protein